MREMSKARMKFSPETLQRIETAIAQYPRKQSAVMTLLHFIQEECGFLSNEAIEWVAHRLEMQPVRVLDLVTFYPHYRREKRGRTRVRLCRTLPCALMGAYKVGDQLETALNCKMGQSKGDGSLTLEYAECLAACAGGPVALVDDDLHENLNRPGSLQTLVETVRNRAEEGASALRGE